MKTIFDDLLAAWGNAFDEINLLPAYQHKVAVVKYSEDQCFELEDFTPGSFPSRTELLDKVPAKVILSYEEYGLDANGLPCYCRTIDEKGQPTFAGLYRYTPDAAEFVRYNLAYRVPHIYERKVFDEGRKTAFSRAIANGGGSRFSGMPLEAAIELAKENANTIFLFVKQYEYEAGRIVRDVSNDRASGIGEYSFTGHYTYDPAGKLVEIKDVFPDGREQLRYIAWDETEGLQELTDRLAREMAAAIVSALEEDKIEPPLAILQLSYHYADAYMPILVPLSAKEKARVLAGNPAGIWEGLFLSGNYLDVQLKGIEKTFTQFMNQVDRYGAHDTAREMLQKTSAILTASRLHGRIPVDEEFFTYAIDGSIEGHDVEDFKKILLNCGMPERQCAHWERKGWLQ